MASGIAHNARSVRQLTIADSLLMALALLCCTILLALGGLDTGSHGAQICAQATPVDSGLATSIRNSNSHSNSHSHSNSNSNSNSDGSNNNNENKRTSTSNNAGDNTKSNSNRTAGKQLPYWHRPGCHRVGHTRTISIPGCVKFNLSTNACRGFCMSFSIPATEDIGPPPEPADGLAGAAEWPSGPERQALSMDAQQFVALIGGQALVDQSVASGRPEPLLVARRMSQAQEPEQQQQQQLLRRRDAARGPLQMGEFLHMQGQTKSPLTGTLGDLGARRDVISVSQCCNMMETEDVTVNLRCGLNETRRLVFKSAKSCECFFCKHL